MTGNMITTRLLHLCKVTKRLLPTAALLVSAAAASAQVAGDEPQPITHGHSQMTAAARQAIEQAFDLSSNRIEVELPAADPRLQIPVCALPLETTMSRHNGQGGRVSVKVDCRDAAPWSRHVAAQVRVFREAIVASRSAGRGTMLSAADITVREVDVSTIRGQILESAETVLGMELRRPASAGDVLSMDMLITPLMVKRGDTVVVTAERSGVVIRQQGVALQDGEAGKQIQIRNARSDRVINAVVTGPGEVKVIF
jgi:flagellar basal body P-ring formation protein FlgA